jgi:hypothetical protein
MKAHGDVSSSVGLLSRLQVDGGDLTRGTRGSAPGPRHDGGDARAHHADHRHVGAQTLLFSSYTSRPDRPVTSDTGAGFQPWVPPHKEREREREPSRSPQTATRHNPLNGET